MDTKQQRKRPGRVPGSGEMCRMYGVRVPPELDNRIVLFAAARQASFSETIRVLLNAGLANFTQSHGQRDAA